MAVASPQGEHIAQLEAVMDSSPQAEKLGALSAVMNASPAMAAQRKAMDMIHNSPRQAAQQNKFDNIFGTAQRVEDKEPLQGKFASASPAQLVQQPAPKPNNNGLKSGIAQRMPLQVQVTGITHLVQEINGSIMEGQEVMEVAEGQAIVIETEEKLRSRRGPNYEIHEVFDRDSNPNYRWFKVLRVNGEKMKGNVFIRDETFHTDDRGMLGNRPAIIGGQGRGRMQPQDMALHGLAEQIINAAKSAPSSVEVLGIVNNWYRGKKTTHDPMKTLRFMQIAYAFSTNAKIQENLGSTEGIENNKAVLVFLQSVTGRQFIQEWSSNPANDVTNRQYAWTSFVAGVLSLGNKPKLGLYLASVLEHDKGYAQTVESAGEYFMYEGEQSQVDDRNFLQILVEALDQHSNMNIWGAGQINSGKISEQLQRLKSSTAQDKILPKLQEESMWGIVVTQLINTKNPFEKDWSFLTVINENIKIVFNVINEIVPDDFELHIDYLEKIVNY